MTSAVAVHRRRPVVAALARSSGPLTLRQATPEDAGAIHDLIARHLDEGHLLPRQLSDVRAQAHRFVVAVDDGEIVGCADLAPLSRTVAEVRSLVVSVPARSSGAGRRLVDALVARAGQAGFERLCAFTHAPAYFVQLGFSIVPHEWLPEKISMDCGTCAQFRRCGQYAVMLPLDRLGPPKGGHYNGRGGHYNGRGGHYNGQGGHYDGQGGHYERLSPHG
jgi:N-acetylglutamate synthase-like GNAT family acetyltransferase